MAVKKQFIVLFVEGETEKEFYNALMKFYIKKFKPKIKYYKIINLKGIGRFEKKVVAKLRYEIIPETSVVDICVVCCYDTDVFDFAQKPPTNWQIVKKDVFNLGITSFIEVKAERMIEDWFLKDTKGLCQFLKIDTPKKIDGKNGVDKLKNLFKRGKTPKIYQKGTYCHKFISNLNLQTIRDSLKKELLNLEGAMGIKKDIQ